MSAQGTTVAFVKSAFYKTCFCIGLGTASYYSYAQVQNWVGDKPATSQAQGSEIQQKVDSLTSFGASGNTTVAMAVQQNPIAAQNALLAQANPKTYLTLGEAKKAADPAAPAASPTDPTAAASPAASPTAEASADKKEGEAKDGEKKEGEEQKTEETAVNAPVPAQGPVNELGFPMGMMQQQAQQQTQPAPAVDSQAQAANAGSYGGGIPTPGSPYSASGSGSSGNGTYTGGGTTYVSPSSGTTSTNTGTTTFLAASDLSLLTSPIKASFTDQTVSVAGLVCSVGAQEGTVTDCVRNNHYAVHTNRWNTDSGLSNDATFTIRSTSSGSSQIKVSVTLKIQSTSQTFSEMPVDVYPTEVLVHSETRNGNLYKVYEIKLPDVVVQGGEKLTGLQATLAYQESTTAGAVATLSNESTLNFARSHVQTMSSIWDITGPNRGPAANEQVIVADSINYSMTLEKAP